MNWHNPLGGNFQLEDLNAMKLPQNVLGTGTKKAQSRRRYE